jgi:hypothetical protein
MDRLTTMPRVFSAKREAVYISPLMCFTCKRFSAFVGANGRQRLTLVGMQSGLR